MADISQRLNQMLEQGHDNLLLRFGLGKALTEQNKPEEAIEHLSKAIEFDQTHASSWFWLGRAYLENKDFKNAQKALAEAEHHATEKGEQQTVRMVEVFQRRLKKQQESNG